MNNDENELFSKNIKYLRRKMNLKQEELAEQLFVTPQAISKWETSKSVPNIQMLITISKLFKISVDELLNVDLENNIDNEKEKDIEMAMDLTSSIQKESVEPLKRNVLVFCKNTKSYKRFIVTNILFFAFFALFIPTFFLPYDIYTSIGLLLVAVMNVIICVYQIKIMCHRNKIGRVYMSSTLKHRRKAFKIALPINFCFFILVTMLFIVFQDLFQDMIFEYIYLIVSILLLAIIEILNFNFYDQALQDAERI